MTVIQEVRAVRPQEGAARPQPGEIEPCPGLDAGGYRQLYAALFLISAAALLLELTLTRIFDVILWTNLANFIVSGAIFGLGLGGIAVLLRIPPESQGTPLLAAAAAGFTAAVLLLIPLLKLLPFDLGQVPLHPLRQIAYFAILYVALLAPFFAVGIVIATILTRYPQQVHRLYFWDLVG